MAATNRTNDFSFVNLLAAKAMEIRSISLNRHATLVETKICAAYGRVTCVGNIMIS